jgi:hypothetical protein
MEAFSHRHELKGLNQQLTVLREEMEKPLPDRETVAANARSLAHQLGKLLSSSEQVHYDKAMLQRLTNRLTDRTGYTAPADWEQATQAYLAGAAVYRAQRDLHPGYGNAALKRTLENLRRQLEFPRGFEGQLEFDK